MIVRFVLLVCCFLLDLSCSVYAQSTSIYIGTALRTTLNYQNTVLTETRLQVGMPDIVVGMNIPFDRMSDVSGQFEYGYASYATKNIEGAPLNLIVPRFLMQTSLQYHTLKIGLGLTNLGFNGAINFGGKIGLPARGEYRSGMDIFQTGRIFSGDSTVQVATQNMQMLIEMYLSGTYRVARIGGQPLDLRLELGYVFGELLRRNLPLDVLGQQGLLGYRTLGIQPITVSLGLLWTLPLAL